jgi:putative ABC transport system permease protein
MTSLRYVWRNVMRHKLRSSLTILSIGFSLALLTILLGYMAMMDLGGIEAKKHNRIVVMSNQGFAAKLPIAVVEEVREIEGVKDAAPFAWFGGVYKEEQMAFAQFATDADHAFNVWDEYAIDPKQLEDWREDRQGCVVDRRLAETRGWQIGDKVPLKGTYYAFDLDLTVRGYFTAPIYTGSLWFHWKYLDEGLRAAKARGDGNAGTVFAKIENAKAIPQVIQTIDDEYASSANPTRTQTEAAFNQMFLDMMGGIRFYILAIGGVVVFALSLVAGTAMAMSMRERTTEIAVLKAIGFPRFRVLRMVLGESCLIALLGGFLGMAIGCALLEAVHKINEQYFPLKLTDFAGTWLLWLVAVAAFIGVASGIVPAVLAARLSVINGLRRVI